MKLYKRLFWFSLAASIISLAVAITFEFFINGQLAAFIMSISLSIFTATLIMIVTSLFEYFAKRKELLTALMEETMGFVIMFEKLEYLQVKENGLCKECALKMGQIMDGYIKVARVANLKKMWHIYDELHFLWGKRVKQHLYKNLFDYISMRLQEIQEASYHFEIYRNGGVAFSIGYDFVMKLQERIFRHEEYTIGVGQMDKSDAEHVAWSWVDTSRGKCCVAINSLTKYLLEMFVEVGKMNYFNNRYNGRDE